MQLDGEFSNPLSRFHLTPARWLSCATVQGLLKRSTAFLQRFKLSYQQFQGSSQRFKDFLQRVNDLLQQVKAFLHRFKSLIQKFRASVQLCKGLLSIVVGPPCNGQLSHRMCLRYPACSPIRLVCGLQYNGLFSHKIDPLNKPPKEEGGGGVLALSARMQLVCGALVHWAGSAVHRSMGARSAVHWSMGARSAVHRSKGWLRTTLGN